LVLAPWPSRAEFYKYYDSNGVLRFTDDLSEIPPKQRAKVKSYVEYDPEKPKTNRPLEKIKDAEKPSSQPELSTTRAQEADLLKRKTDLDANFQALMKEKKVLEDSQKGAKKSATHKQYEQQIKAFNDKVRAYEDKRKAYLEDLAAARSEPQMPQ
jgi:predicted nucleotidyltransferase